jgi:hypothetical protein
MEELSPCTDESGGMSAAPILIGGDGVNRNEAALVGHPRIPVAVVEVLSLVDLD